MLWALREACDAPQEHQITFLSCYHSQMLKVGFTFLALAAAVSAFADSPMVQLAKRANRKASTSRVITNATVGKGEGRVSTGSQPAAAAPTVPQSASTTTSAPAKQPAPRTDTAPLPNAYQQPPQKNSSMPASSAKNVEPTSSAKSNDPTITAHSTTPPSNVKTTQPTANTVKNTTPSTTARFVPSGNQ